MEAKPQRAQQPFTFYDSRVASAGLLRCCAALLCFLFYVAASDMAPARISILLFLIGASLHRLLVDATNCTLTVAGPASSLTACQDTASELGNAPDLLANGVSFVSPFNCSSCAAAGNGTCTASITGQLSSLALLQYYANAWALPSGGIYGTGAFMIRIIPSNPTCATNGTCSDLFPLRASVLLGGGEGAHVHVTS